MYHFAIINYNNRLGLHNLMLILIALMLLRLLLIIHNSSYVDFTSQNFLKLQREKFCNCKRNKSMIDVEIERIKDMLNEPKKIMLLE